MKDKNISETSNNQSLETMLPDALTEVLENSQAYVVETVKKVTNELENTVRACSDSIVQGVAAIKEELNVKKNIEANPWVWLSGACIAGLTVGLISDKSSEKTLGGPALKNLKNQAHSLIKSNSGWMQVVAADIGLMLLRNLFSKTTEHDARSFANSASSESVH